MARPERDSGSGATVDWSHWVSATATRAFCKQDPLLDWLDRYGESKGYLRDEQQPGYDPRTDFRPFILRQGRLFEQVVLGHLAAMAPVTSIAETLEHIQSAHKVQATIEAMRSGCPLISQAVLWNPERQTYGAADLLVRSDVFRELFPDLITEEQAHIPAPRLGTPHHYRVVDVKFTTLNLLKDGHLSGTQAQYMAQVWIYNEALGLAQGFEPPAAYVLGRGWSAARDQRGRNCFERLARVDRDFELRSGMLLGDLVAEAVAWVRRMHQEGASWDALPEPSVPQLYPNMTHAEDQPWHAAKKQIAHDIEELTLLWYVGVGAREQAHRAGVRRWTDPALSASVLGINGVRIRPTLDRILDVNRAGDGPVVLPPRISAGEEVWRHPEPLEFYVDFETVSNLADDFTRIPAEGGQPLIFMIGCGHVEAGAWHFTQFVGDRLDERGEERVIDAWLVHMTEITGRLAPGREPWLLHWSPAEPINYELDYQSAKARHPEKGWPDLRWFDILNRVVKAEPVVVRGALAFGLKSVARAFREHGMIETEWTDGPSDGLGAMVGAWSCENEAAAAGCRLIDRPRMREIAHYNEVDCRVMQEIVAYLRERH